MSFSANEIAELPRVISTPRFATYLQATGGDAKAALSLYLWNLEISAAFLVPLQLCEVAIPAMAWSKLWNGCMDPIGHGAVDFTKASRSLFLRLNIIRRQI